MLLTYIVLTIESSSINQDKKERRTDLILPPKYKVSTVVLHRDYVLISLDRYCSGKTGHSSDRIRQRQIQQSELIDYIVRSLVQIALILKFVNIAILIYLFLYILNNISSFL